jgi:hypothetical protein
MTISELLLQQGISAAKAGDKNAARRLLTEAVRRNPDSEAGWIWLSAVLGTPQGQVLCLRRVLALNPDNRAAQQGLAALEKVEPGPVLVAQPLPRPAVQPAQTQPPPASGALVRRLQPQRTLALGGLVRQQRFWQIAVACLAVVALSLVALLAYATFDGSNHPEPESLAAVVPGPTLAPRGTLRPTFTATPTHTPPPTDTPSPTDTATPTPTHRPVRRRPTETPALAPTLPPTLPPLTWDPRLDPLGVRIEAAQVAPGQSYWRLVEARWTNERQSGGKHGIYVEVLDPHGNRIVGQPVTFEWASDSLILPVEDRPPPDWGVNFPMYNVLGSYAASVCGAPSDRIVGMGLGTADTPYLTVHTCFYLTFRWVKR